MRFFKESVAKFLSVIFLSLTVFSINSACLLINHQENEPESLQKLKKYN